MSVNIIKNKLSVNIPLNNQEIPAFYLLTDKKYNYVLDNNKIVII